MAVAEFNAGTPVKITVTFTDETVTPPALTDPVDTVFVIQPGFGKTPITLGLGSLTHVSTGTYSYTYDTTGVATDSDVEHTVQCQATSGILGTSDPLSFVVKPPQLPGLT